MLSDRKWVPFGFSTIEILRISYFLGLDLLILVASLETATKLRGILQLGDINAAVVYDLPLSVRLFVLISWCAASFSLGIYQQRDDSVLSFVLKLARTYILFVLLFASFTYIGYRRMSRFQFLYFVTLVAIFLTVPRLVFLWAKLKYGSNRNQGDYSGRGFFAVYGGFAVLSIALILALPRIASYSVDTLSEFERTQSLSNRVSAGIPESSLHADISIVADGLQFPVSMDFGPDGRLYFTEKSGALRVIANGILLPDPVLELDVNVEGHNGLLGIAVDPVYGANHHIWISYAKTVGGETFGEGERTESGILRITERDGMAPLVEEAFIVEGETSGFHFINNLRFGPEGMLYISIGDYGNADNAQFAFNPWGKIHQLEPSVPLEISSQDFSSDDSLFAIGLRNVFDFDFSSQPGVLFALDNGEDCPDELNLIRQGGNYGWRNNFQCGPEVQNDAQVLRFQEPIETFDPQIAPTGVTYYTDDLFSELKDKLVFCSWNEGKMYVVDIDIDLEKVNSLSWLNLDEANCQTDVLAGPDGRLYFSSIDAIYVINEVFDE